MATIASWQSTITFTGDIPGTIPVNAVNNVTSIAEPTLVDLASGVNTITVPVSTTAVIARVTIIPPSTNAFSITLKGVTGDTGVPLHITDPTSLGLGTVTSFVLTTGGIINGVRIIWS